MTNLYITKDGVQGRSSHTEKVGVVLVSTMDNPNRGDIKRILSVDNFSGYGDDYVQREEPEISVFGDGVTYKMNHRQLLSKLDEGKRRRMLESTFFIAYQMGEEEYYSGNQAEDMDTYIYLAEEFERINSDADWTDRDWYAEIQQYAINEIKKLKDENTASE